MFVNKKYIKSMELITLAMPVYNAEPYIEKVLLSALNQTYDRIEYIIVDDKGTDRSMDIIRQLILTHPRGNAVRIIEHPVNIGTGAGRNTAINAAQGQFLYFMDNDDEITPDCIQKLYEEMKKSDVDFVAGSIGAFASDAISCQPCKKNIVERDKTQMVNIFNIIYTWNKLYKISFLRDNNIQCIPHNLHEDPYFTFQVAVKAKSYCIIWDVTYMYRDWSITQKVWSQKKFEQFPQIFAAQLDVLKKESFSAVLRRKYKKKAFWFRVAMARFALQTPGFGHSYINRFLSSAYLRDKDTFCDGILFLGYLISIMPLTVKIMFLKFHNICRR